MRIVDDLALLERGAPVILAMGAFDGVHRGHQWLIRQVVNRARALDAESMVITFDPRPEVTLRPGSLQLTGRTEKARLLGALGLNTAAIIPFTPAFSQIPAGNFLSSILDHINLTEFWAGADLAFGHHRQGTVATLITAGQHAGFAVHVVSRRPLDGVPISSTLVRDLVTAGDMAGAALYLGHYFTLTGSVVPGYGRGHGMGFPTANLSLPPAQLLPPTGIYAAYARFDGDSRPAAVSIGYNPVFGNEKLSVEAFVLDWEGDLSGRDLALDLVARLRDEQHFPSIDALSAQIARDVEETRRILASARQPGELILSP